MDENSFGFSTHLAQCTFDLHCQMWEMDEAMCSIADQTVMSHEALYNSSCKFLHHEELFRKNVISNVKFRLLLLAFLTGHLLLEFES